MKNYDCLNGRDFCFLLLQAVTVNWAGKGRKVMVHSVIMGSFGWSLFHSVVSLATFVLVGQMKR